MGEALDYADEFYLTAAAQRNRNYLERYVKLDGVPFAMQEVLYDPQTSGGLLIAVNPGQADRLSAELQKEGLVAAAVGKILDQVPDKDAAEIYVL